MEKFCGCIRLQLGVFICISLSLFAWVSLLAIYIPYILLYSPMIIEGEFESDEDALAMAVPGEDYGTGRVAPVIILLGIFVDILLLAGTYQKYHIKTDLLVPWLFFYAVFSVVLIAVAVIVGMFSDGVYKATAVVPALLAVFYIYIWVCVIQLFKISQDSKNVVIKRLNSVALQPLVALAKRSNRKEYV